MAPGARCRLPRQAPASLSARQRAGGLYGAPRIAGPRPDTAVGTCSAAAKGCQFAAEGTPGCAFHARARHMGLLRFWRWRRGGGAGGASGAKWVGLAHSNLSCSWAGSSLDGLKGDANHCFSFRWWMDGRPLLSGELAKAGGEQRGLETAGNEQAYC